MKQKLRRNFKKRPMPNGASAAIQRQLLVEDWWAAAFHVGLYRSTANEPGTETLLTDLLARGARVAVPARHGKDYRWAWVDARTRWRKAAHGILEPVRAVPVDPAELRVVVVPGVAFDARGGRLGHGGGHFDRLLAQGDALRVGLCFENRLLAEVPMEAHDIRMEVVITDKRVIYAATAEARLERLLGGAVPDR